MSKQVNVRGDSAEVFETSATKGYGLGTRMHVPDGRVFRRAQADTTALVVGRTAQQALPHIKTINQEIAEKATGEKANVVVVNVPVSSAPIDFPVGLFNEGLLYVVSGGGAGHVYRIDSSLEGNSTDGTVTFELDAPMINRQGAASATTSRVTVLLNKFTALTLTNAPPYMPVLGVTPVAVAASAFYWLQVQGATAVLQEGDLRAGLPIAASYEDKGAVTHAVVVVPDPITTRERDVRATSQGLAVVDYLGEGEQQDQGTHRLTSVTGLGVIPPVVLGHVVLAAEDTESVLVHLSIEV